MICFFFHGAVPKYQKQVDIERLVQEVIQELKQKSEGRNIDWNLESFPQS
jgi:hypothetical protein